MWDYWNKTEEKPEKISIEFYTNWIRKRLTKRNKSFNAVICGEPGAGKSWRSQRFGELIDQSFPKTYESKIRFNVDEVYDFFNDDAKRGDVVIWEEAGIKEGAARRQWYSKNNQRIIDLLEIVRYKNCGIIINLPSLSYLDSGIYNLLHAYIECLSLNEQTNMVMCKLRKLQHNPEVGKTYKKNLRITVDGRMYIINKMLVHAPQNIDMIKWYEKRMIEFKDAKIKKDSKEHKQELKEAQEQNKYGLWDTTPAVDKVKEYAERYLKKYSGRMIWDRNKLMGEFNIGVGRCNRLCIELDKVIDRELLYRQ